MARPRTLVLPLLLLFAAAIAAAPAWSATARTAPASAKVRAHARHRSAMRAAPVTPAPSTAPAALQAPGMVVGIDPETGALGAPSRDDMLQLSAAEKTGLLRTSSGLTPVRLADGTLMIPLQGRFMDYSVMRRDASGRLRLGCVDDPRALAPWFDTCAPVAAPLPADR